VPTPKPKRTPVTDLEERKAWDAFFTKAFCEDYYMRSAAESADEMLELRRLRFGGPQREHAGREASEARRLRRERTASKRSGVKKKS
jgi:hypothetical protein